MSDRDFEGAAQAAAAKMKDKNTLVEEWPFRVKRAPGETGAEEEFRMVFASRHSGVQRYVEWTR